MLQPTTVEDKMYLRKAAKEEYPLLAALFVDNVDDTYITASEEEWGRTINGKWKPNLYEIVYKEMVDREDTILLLVLEEDKNIIGYIFCSLEDVPHIEDIIIDKSQRGKGMGKFIVSEALSILKEMGFNSFRAEVGINNITSQKLLKQFPEISIKIH